MSQRYQRLVNYPYAGIVARSLSLPADVCQGNLQRVLHLLKQDLEGMAPSIREYEAAFTDEPSDSLLKQMIVEHRRVESLYQRAKKRLDELQASVHE